MGTLSASRSHRATDASGPASSIALQRRLVLGERRTPTAPRQLDVALDQASYKSGETAKLRIASKLGGKALVAVLSGRVALDAGGRRRQRRRRSAVPVGGDWGAGAYVTAMLYRPMDESLKRMPSRAIGVDWLAVDQAANTAQGCGSTRPTR